MLGAPLSHDFAVISLSDLLTPCPLIEKRLSCAAQAELEDYQADMFCTVFIGNAQTKNLNGKMVTPRGYRYDG